MAAQIGTRKHALACEAIRLGIRLQGKSTMAQYVNQCIGHRMDTEVVLYYSDEFFGTADAIRFELKQMILRIFDLKTGETPAKPDQLLIYGALFCLEYAETLGYLPEDLARALAYDLRIYQNNEIAVYEVDPEDIVSIMKTIVHFDKRLKYLREEEGL